MKRQLKILIPIFFGIYIITGCNRSPKRVVTISDTTNMNRGINDSIESKLNIASLKKDDSIKMAINNMTNKIKGIKFTGNVDLDFATIMMAYQRGAVDMSLQEVKNGTDAAMKALAKEISRNQLDEYSKLGDMAKDVKPVKRLSHGNNKLPEDMAEIQSAINSIEMTHNIDKDYATLMIKHHESEIEMARYEMTEGMNTQLKLMSQKIITDQTKELTLFKSWLSASK